MGTNVVSLWQQVVGTLRDATKDPASCADPLLVAAVATSQGSTLVTKLQSLPPPPRSVWKKLVQQQQVRTALPP